MFKKISALNKLSTLLLYTSILIFIIAFNLAHNPPSGWQQQFMPFLNNRPLADITFLDSLTGYAVTGGTGGTDTNYVLKTTDAGFNWNIIVSKIYDFQRVIFLNHDTGFVLHGDEILRTTDAAASWNSMPVPPDNFGFYDMYPLSWDTMWVCFPYIGGDYVYRTTNAGFIWTRQLNTFSIKKIYMYSGQLGFTSGYPINNFYKTTNSGINWSGIAGNDFVDIYFVDSLTGWKAKGDMKKTTDGGDTWENQPLPNGKNFLYTEMENFSNINKDTIWGGGGVVYSGSTLSGILYRTTNGGENWLYQIPDTSYHIPEYNFINFINKNIGWAYQKNRNGIYTEVGGDTTFITDINPENSLNAYTHNLHQNYPNPFNPKTIISYELKKSGFVTIKVFDILGKEVSALVDKKQLAGSYNIEFDGSGLTSGIYFYSLLIDGNLIDTKKMILIR